MELAAGRLGSGIITAVEKKCKKILVGGFLLFLLLAGILRPINTTRAAGYFPPLSSLDLDLRPEFDHPGVLVEYRMVLSPEVRLPATMTVRIPSRVGTPHQISSIDPEENSQTIIPFQIVKSGDWIEATFTTSSSEISFEYYDPNLLVQDNSFHSFQYNWNGDYQVDDFSIYIQQPVSARNMKISPGLGSAKVGESGIIYYFSRVGEVKQGTTFSIQMSYLKENEDLSVEKLPIKPAGNLDENTAGRTTLQEMIPWIVTILSILIIAALAWWIWLINHSARSKSNGGFRLQFKKPFRKGENQTRQEQLYCQQCGNRVGSKDVFCRVCGARLKSGDEL